MSNDRELRVKIKTEADTAPLNNLTDKTKAYIESLKQGTVDAGKFELKHRELREIINHLTREAPELGLVARYALNPWVASFGVMVYGLNQVSEHYKALAETIRTRVDVKPLQEILDLVGQDGLVKAFDDAGFSAEDFIHQLEKIADAQQTVKGATDDSVESIHAFIDAVKQEKAALAERDLARIHEDQTSGKITSAQAIIQENAVRVRQGDMDRTLASQTEEKIIAAKKAERASLADKLDNAPGPNLRESQIAGLKVAADSAKAAAEEAQKQMDAAKEHYLKNAAHPGEESNMDFNRFKIAQHQNEKAQTASDAAAHGYEQAKTSNEELNKSLLETANQLKALDAEIPKLISQHAAADDSRKFIGQTQHETADLGTLARLQQTDEGRLLTRLTGIQDRADRHQPINASDSRFVDTFNENAAAAGLNTDALVKLMRDSIAHQSDVHRVIQDMQREQDLLRSALQSNSGRAPNSPP